MTDENLLADLSFISDKIWTQSVGALAVDGQTLPTGDTGRVMRLAPWSTLTQGARMDINIAAGDSYPDWGLQFYSDITSDWRQVSGTVVMPRTDTANICVALRRSATGMAVDLYGPRVEVFKQ